MDPEPIPNTKCFYLYRGGLGTREYAPNGVFLCEWGANGQRGADQSIPSYDLVVEIDRAKPETEAKPEENSTHEEDAHASFIEGKI